MEAFARYRKRMLDFIRLRVRRLEDAEDILQDVFYQFARVNNLINPIENISAWLYRTASNRITDHYRKKKDEPFPESYDEDDNKFKINEIAEKTHAQVNTVLSRKHYAVKFLRKRLEELYGDVMASPFIKRS